MASVGKPNFQYKNEDSVLHAYLERQGRNEYINLASKIGYDGSNLAFVFYENQVRRLMDESPYDECRLEVLRASCVGQSREMINLFCAPMKSMSTAQRIEKALSRLRQRYGVTGRLTSEPKIGSIRHGPKVSHNSASLKLFNEDLNTLEVFAYAHNEYDKLSGQLLLDTASRLPNTLKRRYLDYLKKVNVSLNQPSFQSLCDFVLLEIEMTTSDYALAFFKSEDKDKTKEQIVGRGEVRVRRAAVGSGSGGQESGTAVCGSEVVGGDGGTCASTRQRREMKQHQKRPPVCFYCLRAECRPYLIDCEKFKQLSPREKRQAVFDAKRCFNCLSPEHFVRGCVFRSKCRTCGPLSENKHATALHESYVSDPHTA